MEKKFNLGDRVRLKSNGSIVDVVIAKDGWIDYNENRRITGSCPMEEVEPIDQKTAFLTELKDLMNKHNVRFGIDLENKDVSFSFDDGKVSVFSEEFFKIATK